LSCADQPEPPTGRLNQRQVTIYLAMTLSAGDDCRQKIHGLADWSAKQKQQSAQDKHDGN